MRSVNKAYKMGREIGRQVPDVWIADELLQRHIRRTIGPRIKLFKSEEEKSREAWASLLVLTAGAALFSIFCTALLVIPGEPSGIFQFLAGFRSWVQTLPYIMVIVATALLLFLVLAASLAVAAANRRALCVSACGDAAVGPPTRS